MENDQNSLHMAKIKPLDLFSVHQPPVEVERTRAESFETFEQQLLKTNLPNYQKLYQIIKTLYQNEQQRKDYQKN